MASVLGALPPIPQNAPAPPTASAPSAAPVPPPAPMAAPLAPRTLAMQARADRRKQEIANWVVQSGIQPRQGLAQPCPFYRFTRIQPFPPHGSVLPLGSTVRPPGNKNTALLRKHGLHPSMNPPRLTRAQLDQANQQQLSTVRDACLRAYGDPYLSTIVNLPLSALTTQQHQERKFSEFDPEYFFKCWVCGEGFTRKDTIRIHFPIHIEAGDPRVGDGSVYWNADATCTWGM